MSTDLTSAARRASSIAIGSDDRQPILTRRDLLPAAAMATALSTLYGCDRPRPNSRRAFTVRGPSMAPTFFGRHGIGRCEHCEMQFPIPERFFPTKSDPVRCWHCGEVSLTIGQTWLPGEVVWLRSFDRATETLRPGQVVAVLHDDQLRLKRLIALPGQVVDVRARDRALLVNGTPVAQSFADAPTVPVDRDTLRSSSRWKSTPHDTPSAWQRVNQTWRCRGVDPNALLVYTHVAIHANESASPIRDEYPGNLGLSRQLDPVDGLVLTFNLQLSPTASTDRKSPANERSVDDRHVEVYFWTIDGVRRFVTSVKPQTSVVIAKSFRGNEVVEESLPTEVGPTTPIAIRCHGPVTISGLHLDRLVHFRLNRLHDRDDYPMTMGPRQCFVLGDNVPVSIDSRDWGPISIQSIQGVMEDASE